MLIACCSRPGVVYAGGGICGWTCGSGKGMCKQISFSSKDKTCYLKNMIQLLEKLMNKSSLDSSCCKNLEHSHKGLYIT